MTPNQYARLQELSAKLTDVVLFDADPENWIGKLTAAKDLNRDQRGDAYWCRKIAIASISVLTKVTNLTTIIQLQSNEGGAGSVTETEDELDKEVASAEKEATKLLDEMQRRSRKAEFDKRTHGKPA